METDPTHNSVGEFRLSRAIDVSRAALKVAGSGHPETAILANSLGLALLMDYHRRGRKSTTITEAVDFLRTAVTEAHDLNSKLGFTGNLTRALLQRHNEGMRRWNEGVAILKYGTELKGKMHWAGDLTDLQEAVTRSAEAADLAFKMHHPAIVDCATAYCLSLMDLYSSMTRVPMVDEMQQLSQSVNHELRKAMGLDSRYSAWKATPYLDMAPGKLLDMAVSAAERARLAVQGREVQLGAKILLARTLRMRFDSTGSDSDISLCATYLREGTEQTDVPATKCELAVGWGEAEAIRGRWEDAATAYNLAISLLPSAASEVLQLRDREDRLSPYIRLASDAAAVCVNAGQLEAAVHNLEAGRAVLLRQMMKLQVSEYEPGSLSDSPVPPSEDPGTVVGNRQDLREAASRGPVVFLIASRFGSNALIIMPDGEIRSCALPDLSPKAAARFADMFLLINQIRFNRDIRQDLHRALEWMWDAIVEPVLTSLGFTKKVSIDDQWPRIWWIPTGYLSQLPIHAAGYHIGESATDGRTALDRVVSSYAPTLWGLIRARRYHHHAQGEGKLIVAISKTPPQDGMTWDDLSNAAEEAGIVQEYLGDGTVKLADEKATRAAVIEALRHTGIAHFICHAENSRNYASDSYLALYDGRMSVSEIASLSLPSAQLAYLSVCSSAHPGTSVPDEALHITAALQYAGFCNVLGTLWKIDDVVARITASLVYQRLAARSWEGGEAMAVHETTRELRHRFARNPRAWAFHLHVGP